MSDRLPTYAIVGAGFSGMAVAVQLLRRLRNAATVCLVNRSLSFGRGLAYGTNSPGHVLNVPAGRMSLDPQDDTRFVDYLRGRGLPYRASDFVSRSLFGDYLERELLVAQAHAHDGVRLQLVEDEVLGIDQHATSNKSVLHLSTGKVIEPDEVILALGNFSPTPPRTKSGGDWNVRPLVNDVWAAGVFDDVAKEGAVFLVGTGLTAYDAVVSLLHRGHHGPITMLSRRALLPQSHRELETAPAAGIVGAEFLAGVTSLRAQLRAVRGLIREAAESGHDWRDVIGGLRPHTPRLWQQLDQRGKRQFIRHLAPHWDTHRHRAAPAIFMTVRSAIERGQLRVVPGRLLDVHPIGEGVARAEWRTRADSRPAHADFSLVVNCTGPSSDLRFVQEPLITHLRDAGMLSMDAQGLGLLVDEEYRVVASDGHAIPGIRYVGPLLKAQLWEATAVPELRVHAQRLVDALLRALKRS